MNQMAYAAIRFTPNRGFFPRFVISFYRYVSASGAVAAFASDFRLIGRRFLTLKPARLPITGSMTWQAGLFFTFFFQGFIPRRVFDDVVCFVMLIIFKAVNLFVVTLRETTAVACIYGPFLREGLRKCIGNT